MAMEAVSGQVGGETEWAGNAGLEGQLALRCGGMSLGCAVRGLAVPGA